MLFESRVQGIQKPYYKCRIEMYNKQIKKEDDIINYSCTCPVGYSCKHILQTLLKISNEIYEFKEKTNIDNILKLKSKEEIIIAINNILKYNDDIESCLLREFGILLDDSEDEYDYF